MLWYIILLSVIVSIGWLIFGPSENNGGDATLFIKPSDPTRKQTLKKAKFDSVNCNVYHDQGRQVLILYGTAYGFAERLGKKLYMKLRADGYVQPRLVNMSSTNNYIDITQETCIINIVSTAGDGVPPSDARLFVDGLMHDNSSLFSHIQSATLALGDSNYPQFCAAGKLVHDRFMALGSKPIHDIQMVDKEDYTLIDSWFDTITHNLHSLNIPIRNDYLADRQQVTGDVFNRNKPFTAKVIRKQLLTKMGRSDDKEIIHVEIDLTGSNLTYTEGDAIGIVPYNSSDDVTGVLRACKRTGSESVTVDGHDNITTLSDALTQCYDLRVIQNSLLHLLSQHATNGEAVQLTDGIEDNQRSTNKMEVIELLHKFQTAASKLPVQSLCECLRPLQPRYYSISSSPLINANIAAVTAAVVRYDMPTRTGTGVCTTYLADRINVNDNVNVFISVNHDFRLPVNTATPIIMVGPGTGIAPFRAFIQNRIANTCTGTNMLYFGCRHADRDFTYSDELNKWCSSGQLMLRTAFSRDQKEKVYVQDLLEQDGKQVYDMLDNKGAHLYICGDGAAMAKDVHNVLLKVLQSNAGMSINAAEQYLTDLTKQGRYEKDVWIT